MSAPAIPGYRELRELGRGGGGRVVLAEHGPTGARVAVKHLSERLAADPEFVEAFRGEARLLAELDHPNIVRLYEYVEGPHGKAIVMEFVEGASLRALLADGVPLRPEAALGVLQGSLTGLAAAHARGVVHRDFKPDNVLVAGTGESKLADFGIAARSGQAGPAMGTPKYTAPEQWAGAIASPAGDLYAATAVFFECVTAAPPFVGLDTESLRWQHDQAPVPLERVPERLRPLIVRGLAKTPAERPADAGQFLAELREAAVAAYGRDWERRGRNLLAEAALLLLLHRSPGQPPVTSSALAQTTFVPLTVGGDPVPRGLRHPRRTVATAAVGIAAVAAVVLVVGAGHQHSAAADASSPLAAGPTTTTTTADAGPGTTPAVADSQDPASSTPTPSGSALVQPPSSSGASSSASPGRKVTSSASSTTASSHTSAPPSSASTSKPAVPPPPAPKVLSVTGSLADVPGPGTSPVQVTATVTTANASPVTLTLCWAANVDITAGPPWDVAPTCLPPQTLKGNTTYTVSDVYNLPRVCTYGYTQVVATTVPAAPGGPVTTSFNPSAGCIF